MNSGKFSENKVKYHGLNYSTYIYIYIFYLTLSIFNLEILFK